ncbi:hypothetical protein NBRC111894_1713 [Sporolactobacillus inulinus]|uniref:Uncharacterized protein n=1 Tax=Sporolactobacillus inulinus TaxID=2078 RepID=A0A4Y1ZAU9_9BACL|nr:hypothetical protein NBRC111894_1713 [Sporolactobacillus inulinus]
MFLSCINLMLRFKHHWLSDVVRAGSLLFIPRTKRFTDIL